MPLEVRPLVRETMEALQTGRLDMALVALDKMDAIRPDLCDTLLLRASVLLKKKDFEAAGTILDKAEELYPGFTGHPFNRAEWHFVAGDYATARELFSKIESGSAQGALIAYKIALCDLMAGNREAVEELLERTPEDPGHPLCHYVRAAALFYEGKKAVGMEVLQAAYRIYPRPVNGLFTESLVALGWISPEEGRPKTEVPEKTESPGMAIPDLDLGLGSIMAYAAQMPPRTPGRETEPTPDPNRTASLLPGLEGGKKSDRPKGE